MLVLYKQLLKLLYDRANMKKDWQFCVLTWLIFVGLVIYVTGFWKTNEIVTLGLLYFIGQVMAALIYYPFTVPLPGLVDWSALLGQVMPTM